MCAVCKFKKWGTGRHDIKPLKMIFNDLVEVIFKFLNNFKLGSRSFIC